MGSGSNHMIKKKSYYNQFKCTIVKAAIFTVKFYVMAYFCLRFLTYSWILTWSYFLPEIPFSAEVNVLRWSENSFI